MNRLEFLFRDYDFFDENQIKRVVRYSIDGSPITFEVSNSESDECVAPHEINDHDACLLPPVTYDGSGNIIGENDSDLDHRWTAREFEVETNFQYNRARCFDPEVGRWTSGDPLAFDASDCHVFPFSEVDRPSTDSR